MIWIVAIIGMSYSWPAKTFAPYIDISNWPTMDVSVIAKATGVKHYTLAFIVADKNSQPAWAGIIPLTQNFYSQQIASLRALGGDVIISFGGATGAVL